MSSVACPHCSFAVADAPSLAGQTVLCPRCSQPFEMPGSMIRVSQQELLPPPPPPHYHAPAPQYYPPPQPQPTTIIVTGPPPQERLGAGGWFTRAFAATSGYMLASMLFTIGIPIIGLVLLCGGCFICSGMLASVAPDAEQLAQELERQPQRERERELAANDGANGIPAYSPTDSAADPSEPQPTSDSSESTERVGNYISGPRENPWKEDLEKLKKPTPAPESTAAPLVPETPAATSRTWKSASGKFTIEATYLGIKNQKVSLGKADGTTIEVPLTQLSESDRNWIANEKFRR